MSAPGLDPISPRLGDIVAHFVRLGAAVGAWRQKRRSSPAWTVAVALILLVVALPEETRTTV